MSRSFLIHEHQRVLTGRKGKGRKGSNLLRMKGEKKRGLAFTWITQSCLLPQREEGRGENSFLHHFRQEKRKKKKVNNLATKLTSRTCYLSLK